MRPTPPEMPDDPIADGEPPSIEVLRTKTRAELDDMAYVEKWWTCAAQGCKCRTTVRDYGDPTHFYWRRRFMNRYSYYYLCCRHSKIERKFLQHAPKNMTIADVAKNSPFPLKPFDQWFVLETKIPKDDRKRTVNDVLRSV